MEDGQSTRTHPVLVGVGSFLEIAFGTGWLETWFLNLCSNDRTHALSENRIVVPAF